MRFGERKLGIIPCWGMSNAVELAKFTREKGRKRGTEQRTLGNTALLLIFKRWKRSHREWRTGSPLSYFLRTNLSTAFQVAPEMSAVSWPVPYAPTLLSAKPHGSIKRLLCGLLLFMPLPLRFPERIP